MRMVINYTFINIVTSVVLVCNSITHLCVCHPTAGLHLVGVEAPELQLLLEQRPTNVCGIVQFARSVRNYLRI